MKTAIKKSVCIFLVLIMIFFVSGCGKQDKDQLHADLTATLKSMLGTNESDEAYISGINSHDKTSYQVLMDNDTGKRIGELIEYQIDNIEISQEKATVDITIKAPDIYQMLCQIVRDKNINDADSLLKELSLQLNSQYQPIEKTVTCNMEYKNEHWYLITNNELSNILSGNLYEYYANLGKNTVEELTGGENQ
ncbi:MAG: hypothetical protein J6Q94_10405 [Clostridia bacterium]|nr:hypothetical protein [Clostridia bacterium]